MYIEVLSHKESNTKGEKGLGNQNSSPISLFKAIWRVLHFRVVEIGWYGHLSPFFAQKLSQLQQYETRRLRLGAFFYLPGGICFNSFQLHIYATFTGFLEFPDRSEIIRNMTHWNGARIKRRLDSLCLALQILKLCSQASLQTLTVEIRRAWIKNFSRFLETGKAIPKSRL